MPHIQMPVAPELGREFPGIVGPMTYRPETAAPINELVNILLRGESTLTRGERELIATHVSWRNDCFFCQTIHGAVAAAQLDHNASGPGGHTRKAKSSSNRGLDKCLGGFDVVSTSC